MGSSSDWPLSPWLLQQMAHDREDIAAGREPWDEAKWLEERRQARAASKPFKPWWQTVDEDDLHRIYSEAERPEAKL